MAVTSTETQTLQKVMDQGVPGQVESALQKAKVGTMLTPQKWTIVGATSLAAQDITSANVASVATAGASTPALATGGRLSAALSAGALAVRVTAGAAAAGPRIMTDSGGTPSATVATLSADGKTITFEAAVTAFVLEYVPRAGADMTSVFVNA